MSAPPPGAEGTMSLIVLAVCDQPPSLESATRMAAAARIKLLSRNLEPIRRMDIPRYTLSHQLADRGGNLFRRWRDVSFERRRVGHRRARTRDAQDRRLQRGERFLRRQRGNFRGDAARAVGLVDADQPAGPAHRG